MEWLLLVLLVATAWGFWFHHQEKARDEQRAAERAQRKAAQEAKLAAIETDLLEWTTKLREEGWSFLSRGQLMHKVGQPHCIIALSGTAPLLRVDEIGLEHEFTRSEPIYINLREIISLSVARPKVRKSRKETVHFPITENHRKSPVARGLIGGAILGPAGLVIGAASGLNSQITTTVQSKTVFKDYEGLGDPQLIIGTNRDDFPYFKIRCANQEVADEWAFRIRGRQSKGY